MAYTRDDALNAIMTAESGGRNVPNYMYDSGHTAQGYFQITNSTWRAYAGQAGVDVSQYPNAMSAPYDVQRQVAGTIYDQRGFADWSSSNPQRLLGNGNNVTGPVDGGGTQLAGYDYSSGYGTGYGTQTDALGNTWGGGDGSAGSGSESAGSPDIGQTDAAGNVLSPSAGSSGTGASAITPGTGYPLLLGVQTGVQQLVQQAETAVGNQFRAWAGAVSAIVNDYVIRAMALIVGLVLLALAAYRLMTQPAGSA